MLRSPCDRGSLSRISLPIMIFAFYRKKNNVMLNYIIFLALFVDSPIASMQWKVIVSAFCILKINL